MEKVIAINTTFEISLHKLKEVNEYLEDGWKVKLVTSVSHKEGVSSIFVLEK